MLYCNCQDDPELEVIEMKQIYLLLSLMLLLPFLSGCSSPLTASLNSQFTLAPGQSVRIASESMEIKFIGETQDSRCPTGVDCFWAGQVICDIELIKDGNKNQITLTESAGSGLTTGYTFQNYKITFAVSPYPVAGKTIAKSDYRLSLTISKSGS
jgi:hypothetical protein